jgi:hypothetical protein
MSGWTKVRWTQARQVTRLMGVKDREAPPETVAPEAYCGTLKSSGQLHQAVSFIGHALPRFESVAWATDQVKAIRGKAPSSEPGDAAAFDAVVAWLEDPADPLRRTAYDASQAIAETSPEQLLGYAVFFSGGSISPEGQQPILPNPEVCGRFAAGAVMAAADAAEDGRAALAAAIAAGEALAAGAPRTAG